MKVSRNPFNWIYQDLTYRCTLNGENKRICKVTGKVVITLTTVSCFHQRSGSGMCGSEGRHWKPSKEFLSKKENLLKIITDPDCFNNGQDR